MEIVAIAVILVLVFLVGLAFGRTPNDHLCYLQAERLVHAESEASRLYREMENMRRDQIRLASYPLYQVKEPLTFEIQKLLRVDSQKEAKDKYGENYLVTDAIIGKLNEVIEEVNHPRIKRE